MRFGIAFDGDAAADDSSKNSNFHLVSTCIQGSLFRSYTFLVSLLLKKELEELTEIGLFSSKTCASSCYPILLLSVTVKIVIVKIVSQFERCLEY